MRCALKRIVVFLCGLSLSLCAEDIEVTYPDPGRNWKGKQRGRVVMTAIFGQLARLPNMSAKYTIDETTDNTIRTEEDWGHANMKIKTTYTFTEGDYKILSMVS